MGILSKYWLDRLDEAGLGGVQIWEFGFRSLRREYARLFFWRAVLAHPAKALRGLSRYRRYVHENRRLDPESRHFFSIPDEAMFLQNAHARNSGPLLGLGFCLKPYDPEVPARSCPSGRANHDCLYFEQGETRSVCAGCSIHELGRLALAKGWPVYIMTSARDIARDFMLPQINRGQFPSAVLILCPYSIQAIILPLLICGVEMMLLPYASGSCADYGQWLTADKGFKEEQTAIAAESRERLLGALIGVGGEAEVKVQGQGGQRFRRVGNVFYPKQPS